MKITIYGTPVCPNCKNVLAFLKGNKADYEYKVVGDDVSKEQLEETVGRSVRAVPVIVVDGDELSFASLRNKVSMAT
jgi:glutaredoxin